jgi:hypothetical protein
MTLPLLLLTFAPCARAQDDAPEFKMPCAQVLKLGLNKFMEVYGEKTGDESTYGMKQGFAYYVDCKRPFNDTRAGRLVEDRRKHVNAVRDELQKIGNAAWTLAYIEAGGGTMYGLASVSAYADREDFMTTFIAALAVAGKPQPAARRRANASIAETKRLLDQFSRTPELDVYEGDQRTEQLKQHRETVKEAKDAAARLESIIRLLPDVAAEHAARRMAEELEAGVED